MSSRFFVFYFICPTPAKRKKTASKKTKKATKQTKSKRRKKEPKPKKEIPPEKLAKVINTFEGKDEDSDEDLDEAIAEDLDKALADDLDQALFDESEDEFDFESVRLRDLTDTEDNDMNDTVENRDAIMLKVLEQGIDADFKDLQTENLVLKRKVGTLQENYCVLKERYDKFEQQITSMLLQKSPSISTIHQARTSSTTPQQAVLSPEQHESLIFRNRSFDTTPQPRTPLAPIQPLRTRTPF